MTYNLTRFWFHKSLCKKHMFLLKTSLHANLLTDTYSVEVNIRSYLSWASNLFNARLLIYDLFLIDQCRIKASGNRGGHGRGLGMERGGADFVIQRRRLLMDQVLVLLDWLKRGRVHDRGREETIVS